VRACFHLLFELVQHRHADVRVVEDQHVRRIDGLDRARGSLPQLGDGRAAGQQTVAVSPQRVRQAEGKDGIFSEQQNSR
jgi:hypothetical protein